VTADHCISSVHGLEIEARESISDKNFHSRYVGLFVSPFEVENGINPVIHRPYIKANVVSHLSHVTTHGGRSMPYTLSTSLGLQEPPFITPPDASDVSPLILSNNGCGRTFNELQTASTVPSPTSWFSPSSTSSRPHSPTTFFPCVRPSCHETYRRKCDLK
jgi:hypothetical protein